MAARVDDTRIRQCEMDKPRKMEVLKRLVDNALCRRQEARMPPPQR